MPKTLPAIVAKPPVMSAVISLRVIRARYGRTTSGASVCPRKTFEAVASDSAPLTPSARWSRRARNPTMRGRTPT